MKIKDYQKTIIVLLSKDLNDPKKVKYLNHIFQDSYIYNEPISGYFIHNQDTILVYSKKDNFVNPWKYPPEFSAKMKQQLNDTESKYKQKDGDYLNFNSPLITNHSHYWKVERKNLIKGDMNFDPFKFLYGGKNNWGYDYDGKGDSLGLKIGKYN